VAITLAVEAFAIPLFVYWANDSRGQIYYFAAICGAVAAICALGTLRDAWAAREMLIALASVSLVLASLQLPIYLTVLPIPEMLLANSVFAGTSATVIALLCKRSSARPSQTRSAVFDVLVMVGVLLGSIALLICLLWGALGLLA
jgi:hypothetical protein